MTSVSLHCAKLDNQSSLNSHEFPIHAAAASGCPQTLTRVINSCSWRDVYSSDQLGRTPLHLAAAKGCAASVAVLTHAAMLQMQHGVVGNALDVADKENRWTALHWAAYSGRLQVMSMLLQAGADPSLRDFDGMTAWEILDASNFEQYHSNFSVHSIFPRKVCWRNSNKSEAFSFGLTKNYSLGYDTGCHVVYKPRAVSLPSKSSVLFAACSSSLSLFVTNEGVVYACGLGDHDRLMMQVPFCVEPVPLSLPHSVVSVAIGKRHCLALTADGDVFGWGCNDRCQLGNPRAIRKQERAVPVKILSGISAISAGFAHSAAVSRGGDTLFVWGDNSACQCSQPRACPVVPSPAAARVPSGLKVTAVSCGLLHTSFVAETETPTAYVFGAGSAATTQLLLLSTLSQIHWHLMPDCNVGAVAAGDDWTAVVTLVSQRCYLWRHEVGHVGSPTIIPLPRHVKVLRIASAPSRLVLLLSDDTVLSVPVNKRPSDRILGIPETLCRQVGCRQVAASEGTCLLICNNLLLSDGGMWRDVAGSHQLPLQRICEVSLCSTLTSANAPSALQLALSIGAPVLAIAAALACLMDPIYTCSYSLSEPAWNLLEMVVLRLKQGSPQCLVGSENVLTVLAVVRDLVDDWGGLMLNLIKFEETRACNSNWEASVLRFAKLSKSKLKQKEERGSETRSQANLLSSFCPNPALPQDVTECSIESVSVSSHAKSSPLPFSTQISEFFPPLALDVQQLGSARTPRKRIPQVRLPQPCSLPSTTSSTALPATVSSPVLSCRLDPHDFPTLSHATVTTPPPNNVKIFTPKTKSKSTLSDRSTMSSRETTHAEIFHKSVANVPDSGRKKHRQKYRYEQHDSHQVARNSVTFLQSRRPCFQ